MLMAGLPETQDRELANRARLGSSLKKTYESRYTSGQKPLESSACP
jgi:hypothetical protein